jgi:hypothetical protein
MLLSFASLPVKSDGVAGRTLLISAVNQPTAGVCAAIITSSSLTFIPDVSSLRCDCHWQC